MNASQASAVIAKRMRTGIAVRKAIVYETGSVKVFLSGIDDKRAPRTAFVHPVGADGYMLCYGNCCLNGNLSEL